MLGCLQGEQVLVGGAERARGGAQSRRTGGVMWACLCVPELPSREKAGSGFQKWGVRTGQQPRQTSPLHVWVHSRRSGLRGPGLCLLPRGAQEVVMTA